MCITCWVQKRADEAVVFPDGSKLCSARSCKTILKPGDPRKRCRACRALGVARAARRRRIAVGEVVSEADNDDDDELDNMPLAKRLELKRRMRNLKKLKLRYQGVTVANVEMRPKEARKQQQQQPSFARPAVIVSDGLCRFPSYQTSDALMDDFRTRLLAFVKTQTIYLMFRVSKGAELEEPMVFAFEGEFSEVSDPAGGEVTTRIEQVKKLVGSGLGITFSPTRVNADQLTNRVYGLFSCVCEMAVPVAPPTPVSPDMEIKPDPEPKQEQPADSASAVVKRMAGELEVSVSWDRSHKYFPGMRTVVRFRLIG